MGKANGGGLSAPPDVHVGRDGWLFWIGRPGVMLPLYRHRPGTWRRLFHWRQLIGRRIARARALGCRYVQVVVPDKLSVYDDQLAAPIVDAARSPALRLGRAVRRRRPDHWIDLLDAFRSARHTDLLYPRTDTHWTRAGYLLAYRLVCEALGAAPQPHVLQAPFEWHDVVNDVGNKVDPPVTEPTQIFTFERRARRTEENALVTFRDAQTAHVVGTSVGSRIVTRAEGEGVDPRRLVVFGDSYTFHAYGLGPMLAETFAEVHCVWSSPVDWAYVERVRPDVMIHELAERFLFRTPTDGLDIDAFAAARLAEAVKGQGRDQ